MVINSIIDGISIKVNELFGDNYNIYSDNVEQGMEKPCFFIHYIDGEESRQVGIKVKSFLDILHFDIAGFAENDDRTVLYDMIDKLYDLEYITLENGVLLRADGMKPKIEDEVLHFFIDYKVFIDKESNKIDEMIDYNTSEEVKKDD